MNSLRILFLIFFTYNFSFGQNDAVSTGRVANNFSLESVDRETITLNDCLGKGPILLCFWSSCCKTAIAQIEDFASLYEKYKNAGFNLLAIATDDVKTVAKVKPLVKIKKFNFPVLYDTERSVARKYYAYNNPFCVLIDKNGRIIFSHLGYMKGDKRQMDLMIEELLSN